MLILCKLKKSKFLGKFGGFERGTTTIISNPTFTFNRTLPKVKREVTGIACGMLGILVG